MLEELLGLGFDRVELGHGIRLSLMEEIQRFYDEGKVAFTSLHNFCPLPVEITRAAPDCYQFSSHRESERERAIKLTLQTIDFAARLGAPRVVLHLGRVPMNRIVDELADMADKGEHLSRAYVRKKLKAVQRREKRAPLYLQRAKDAINRVLEHAAEKNIHLGIESRSGYDEIPSEREIPPLLDEIGSPYVGYWHDFGHIQLKANLGFVDHAEWLARIRGRLLGCHLHDVEWPAGDHRAPFTGMINYDALIPLLPRDTLFVWEMSPRRKREEIVRSLEQWKERFGE